MKPPSRSVRPCRLVFPALAAAFLLSLATGASLATDPPAGSAPAATDNAAVPVAPAADNGWVDRPHSRVERDLFDTVAWFDRFFGDERIDVTERPESFLRWMNALRWDEEERFSFRSTVRASLRLPSLRNRWRLVVSGETRGDPNAVTPEDPGNPGLDEGSRVLARYRRDVYRKWLFLEGEPDLHWPRKEDGTRKPVWGATLRAEILFTGAGPDPQDDGGGVP